MITDLNYKKIYSRNYKALPNYIFLGTLLSIGITMTITGIVFFLFGILAHAGFLIPAFSTLIGGWIIAIFLAFRFRWICTIIISQHVVATDSLLTIAEIMTAQTKESTNANTSDEQENNSASYDSNDSYASNPSAGTSFKKAIQIRAHETKTESIDSPSTKIHYRFSPMTTKTYSINVVNSNDSRIVVTLYDRSKKVITQSNGTTVEIREELCDSQNYYITIDSYSYTPAGKFDISIK